MSQVLKVKEGGEDGRTKELILYIEVVNKERKAIKWGVMIRDHGTEFEFKISNSKKAYELVALLLGVKFPFLERRHGRYVFVRRPNLINGSRHRVVYEIPDDFAITPDLIDAIKTIMDTPPLLYDFEPKNRDDLLALLYVLKTNK